MKEEIILVFALLSLALVCVSIGYFAQEDINSLIRKIKSEKIETPEQCINLSMVETAYCLNNYINSIYKYKKTNDLIKLTFEELKEEGGDCLNWAELYISYIDNLDFYSEMVVISTNKGEAHAFAIMSDDTGYCILDQMSLDCLELDN